MRSWIVPMVRLAVVVSMAKVCNSAPSAFGSHYRSHRPAKVSAQPSAETRWYGCFVPFTCTYP